MFTTFCHQNFPRARSRTFAHTHTHTRENHIDFCSLQPPFPTRTQHFIRSNCVELSAECTREEVIAPVASRAKHAALRACAKLLSTFLPFFLVLRLSRRRGFYTRFFSLGVIFFLSFYSTKPTNGPVISSTCTYSRSLQRKHRENQEKEFFGCWSCSISCFVLEFVV